MRDEIPDLPTGYYDILTERLKENQFTDQRLKDAVDNVIDTCTYFKPTIADVIGFDIKKEVYRYSERIKS